LATLLYQRTDGLPLFLVTLVDYLQAQEALAKRRRGGARHVAAVAQAILDTLRQTIAHQLVV
jgi:hypothetical protein